MTIPDCKIPRYLRAVALAPERDFGLDVAPWLVVCAVAVLLLVVYVKAVHRG